MSGSSHFPSSNRNSLAAVSDNSVWVIRAFIKICKGMLKVDDSVPAHLGGNLVDQPSSFMGHA